MKLDKSFFLRFYFSPFGRFLSFILKIVGSINVPFMIYGYYNNFSHVFNYKTRVSNTVKFINKKAANIADNVWIWHYSIIDATGGLKIEEGVQIGAWVGIFTHSSHNAIRLNGPKYFELSSTDRSAFVTEGILIGSYSFIGASSVILPGVKLGKGCIVSAGSVVKNSFPDYSIISGNPAVLIGKTDKLDAFLLKEFKDTSNYYLNHL